MIIAKKFVFINFPKTGSTFVRKNLKKLKETSHSTKKWGKIPFFDKFLFEDFRFLNMPNIRAFGIQSRWMKPTEHGLRIQIPQKYNTKEIVSIKRNPFELAISLYEFRDWVKTFSPIGESLKTDFPPFPNISFKEFLEFREKYSYYKNHPEIKNFPSQVGVISMNFICFFAKSNPFQLINTWNEGGEDIFIKEVKEVVFLENSNLNLELYQYLQKCGYPESQISFIIDAKKENTTHKNKKTSEYFDNELAEEFIKKEYLLFKIFPEYLPANEIKYC